MKKICQSEILKNEQLAEKYWQISLYCPAIAKNAKPGHFVEIYFKNSVKIFPRPFSIASATGKTIDLIYKVIGSQTKIMTTWKVGTEIEILGPLGNTFEIGPKIKTHILVGGGVGLAPMVFMSEVLSQKKLNFAFFSGGRNDKEYFPDLNGSEKMFISTDDGSQGFHGNIIQLLEKEIGNFARPAVIYACGPEKMSEAVKYFGEKHNIETQISMETLMACGMGLCQGCAIKTYDEAGHDSISLVCKDGPVFRGDEINFD